jgi:hypothetical protein
LTSSSVANGGPSGAGEAVREGDDDAEDMEVRVSMEVVPSDREVQ